MKLTFGEELTRGLEGDEFVTILGVLLTVIRDGWALLVDLVGLLKLGFTELCFVAPREAPVLAESRVLSVLDPDGALLTR